MKALKGEAQECWRLKKFSKDIGSENRQMGSQTQKAESPEGTAKSSGALKKAKADAPTSINAVGSALCKVLFEDGSWSTWNIDRKAACWRNIRSGGVEVHERMILVSRILEDQAAWELKTVRSG